MSDLLDEATRLADDYRNLDEARILRALIERVRQAEAETLAQEAFAARVVAERDEHKTGEGLANGVAERWAKRCMKARAERDAARGKLDKVRELVTNPPAFINREHGLSIYGHADLRDDLLAILDEKTGD